MNDCLIAPSILAADFGNLAAQIKAAEQHGADWIHIDVMDGQFVPNLTVGPAIVAACRRATSLKLDVHLMVERPERYLETFVKAGADSLTVHVEATPHIHRAVQQIRGLGVGVGVALNPGTPVEAVQPVLSMVDLILVMSVNPGFGGQEFIPQVLTKVQALREDLDSVNPNALIQLDGGITEKTIKTCHFAGCRVFVAGSAIFRHPEGIAAGILALQHALPH